MNPRDAAGLEFPAAASANSLKYLWPESLHRLRRQLPASWLHGERATSRRSTS